jgi:hypothetical protein
MLQMSWWNRKEKVVEVEAEPCVCGFILLTAGTIKLMPEIAPQQAIMGGSVADDQNSAKVDQDQPKVTLQRLRQLFS